MALRPLVIRLHYYLPGARGDRGVGAAQGHLRYMGNPAKEELCRAGQRQDPGEEAAIHAAYMAGRPGSLGYFGPDERHLPDPEALDRELRGHRGPIWRLVVSVTEADARAMGGQLLDRPAWEDAARSLLPKMARELGIPEAHLRWVAAVHRKEGHPHLHLLAWEVPPKRTKGRWSPGEMRQVKRMWVSALYRPERERLGQQMAAAKLAVVGGGRVEVAAATALAGPGRRPPATPPRLSPRRSRELAARLDALRTMLPGGGRVALAYMPPGVKQAANDRAEWLLSSVPEYQEAADRYAALAREMARHYSDDPAAHDQAARKAREDLTQKLAQHVLRGAADLDRAAKRDQVVQVALATIRGRGAPGLPPELAERVHREVLALARLPANLRPDAALALARRLLAEPALASEVRWYLEALPPRRRQAGEERLAASLARSIAHAADYAAHRREVLASSLAVAWWSGLMRDVRREERRAEAREAEEEARRKRREGGMAR